MAGRSRSAALSYKNVSCDASGTVVSIINHLLVCTGFKASQYCRMAHSPKLETAAEYGRRSHCLRDYREPPFCFGDNVAYIHATVHKTVSDGLVEQPGLNVCPIPQPMIDFNTSIDYQGNLLDYLGSSPSSPSRPWVGPRVGYPRVPQ